MRYWGPALAAVVLLAAAISAAASALYFLVLVGSCESGTGVVTTRPCPEGTGLRILLVISGVFASLAAIGLFRRREPRPEPGAPLGKATWVLGFLALAAAFLMAGFGPDAPDPSTGDKVFVSLMAALFAGLALPPVFASRTVVRKRAAARRLLTQGERATAVVTAVHDTNVTINDNPRVRVDFEIRPALGEPFNGSKTMVVSRVAIPRVGDEVTAWYDPADRETFMVSFDPPEKIDEGLARMRGSGT